MVLGLINFLLGGGRKQKVARNAQVKTGPTSTEQSIGTQQIPDGVTEPTQNVGIEETQKKETQNHMQQQVSQQVQQNSGPKRSVAEALSKFHSELKATNNRITELVTSIKTIENTVNSLGHRIDEMEGYKKETSEKFSEIDSNMSKFLSLYELINNQYNPFVSEESKTQAKKVEILSDGSSQEGTENLSEAIEKLSEPGKTQVSNSTNSEDLESSLLELDTLNIEEAAGNAVPLTRLKNNTNSLVIILSWLEYLIKRVGIEETRNTLRYYTEVLRWTTPEVYFDLDKYLRGMKDKKDIPEGETLSVRDHIVSLYFISKLNEKSLDEKLTKAVLQIIKN
jgi:archaellum component FlaD/FlaE